MSSSSKVYFGNSEFLAVCCPLSSVMKEIQVRPLVRPRTSPGNYSRPLIKRELSSCLHLLADSKVCVNMGTEPPPSVRELQATLFPPMMLPTSTSPESPLPLPRLGSGSFLGSFLLKNGTVLGNDERANASFSRIRDPIGLRDAPCPAPQPARWPAECQVLDERIEHVIFNPPSPEQYYSTSGREATPKPLGNEFGTVVYQYYPISAINYFNRSCTGGCPYLQSTNMELTEEDLRFESRFESGNLAKAIKLTTTFYELYVRTDLYTNRHSQWFYFRIKNVKRNLMYRFSIVNLSKGESLYAFGMKPLMYSAKDAKLHSIGWRRCGENIAYYSNENGNPEEEPSTFTLTFTMEFPHDGDTVYLAHSYPYTYSDLQDYLMALVNHPVKSAYSSLRLLCRSLAGNNVYYVTVTSPSNATGDQKKKKAIVLTARVHPGESPSSWMMKGLLDFLTGDTSPARELRDKFIFKLIPMLNPDGVIVGNSRCSLTGRDLNRQYRTVIRETYPSIWHTKLMVRRLVEECGVAMYCDFHAHSRQNNVFIYGCENRRGFDRYLHEQVFPLMLHKNAADKFSFESCKFRVQRAKEGTGRVVMWMMGICNSYTMEASFAGSDLGPRVDTHFSIADYEQMGRIFCQTLLDFYDDTPNKEKLRCKILRRLLKEGSTADEPTNINLSDYSSDGGNSSSSDEASREPYTPPLVVPPPSPNLPQKILKKKVAPAVKTIPKSPTVQRKILPMYHTTLGLSLAETDSSSSDSENEVTHNRSRRTKTRKILRRKKTRKTNKNVQEHSDTEIQLKKHSRKSLSVLELIPAEKLRSQSWNRFAGFPIPKALDIRHVRNTTRQLAEVQARLISLRQRIWTGMDDGNEDNQPLSWGYSSFTASNITNPTREAPKKIKDLNKSKSCDEGKKNEKKTKKKNKKHKEEAKKQSQKKKTNGIKRQTAVDWSNYDNRRKTVKSKSLQDENEARVPERRHSAVESSGELDSKKKTKKKKKRKGNWEKKTKTIVNVNTFVRKVNF